MSNRINIGKVLPAAYKAMLAFEGYVNSTSLTKTHKELIKIRASQINGCGYCLDMHTKDARAAGEAEHRIYTLSAWEETPFFDEQERALLALTEEITLIHNRVSDETYAKAAAVFDETYLAEIVMAIIVINSWSRIAIFGKFEPPVR